MRENLTRIRAKHLPMGCGIIEWGEHDAETMIKLIRRSAQTMRERADAILATPDEAFDIDVVRGPIVRRHVKIVQKGLSQ